MVMLEVAVCSLIVNRASSGPACRVVWGLGVRPRLPNYAAVWHSTCPSRPFLEGFREKSVEASSIQRLTKILKLVRQGP